MLHLLADPRTDVRPQPYAEAVARLASVRHALRLVEPFGAGPAPDIDDALEARFADAGDARRRLFDRRSERLVGATASGVEALLIERQASREPHAAASRELVEQIERELAEVARVVLA
jgi:hypothetical protein